MPPSSNSRRTEDEWLWGWDPTPGIVSVWAEADGRVAVWRRLPDTGELVREEARFRPWLLLDRLDDLQHLAGGQIAYQELAGPGTLRYLVSADDAKKLSAAILAGATRRLGRRIGYLRDLGKDAVLALPLEEQYLVATGRTYFRDLSFDQLHRMQFDLETTGLDVSPGLAQAVGRASACGRALPLRVVPPSGSGRIGELLVERRPSSNPERSDPE